MIGTKGRVGKKGEIYIPKKIRESVGLMPGDEIEVDVDEGKLVIRKKPTALDLLKEKPLATVKVEEMREIRKRLSEKLTG